MSDRGGEEEIYLQTQDGNEAAEQITARSTTRYYAPHWSNDDKRIAFADNTDRLYVVEVTTKRRYTIAKDPAELTHDYR